MKTINLGAITKAVQEMINKGTVTFMSPDCLVYHSKSGAYKVGSPDDILTVWNLISAYKNRDSTKN